MMRILYCPDLHRNVARLRTVICYLKEGEACLSPSSAMVCSDPYDFEFFLDVSSVFVAKRRACASLVWKLDFVSSTRSRLHRAERALFRGAQDRLDKHRSKAGRLSGRPRESG